MKGSGGNISRGRHNRSRASNFRKSSGLRQVIRLVDVIGNVRTVRRRGRMNSTSHTAVIDALSHRPINLCGKTRAVSYDKRRQNTIDETGSLDITGLNLYNENEALQ